LGDEHAARDALQEVLAQEENNSEAHNHLGVLLEQMGDTDLAATHFRLALKHTPNHASSFYQLSKLKDHPLLPQEIEKIESLLEDSQLPDMFRASLLFALAWEFEYRKEYLKSIDYFIEAQAVKARRSPYVQSDTLLHVEKSQQVFPVTWQASREMQDDLPVPIFIVGMPRSGTTLTEQIIASHSDITGAGEVVFASDMLRQASEMTGKAFPESIEQLSIEQARQLRTTYLSRMLERFGRNRFVVDKSPGNFNFLGTIAAVFPEAKILFCKRNAMDNCVSIFRLPFDDNQKWAHNLSALGHYYVQHEVLMKYWQTCYAKQILQVDYEDTVGDVEQQARRILDFIGVDFQEQVLSFYANKRIVMTPSSEQVRQPIYKTSVNAWKRYGDALKPLKEALSE
jgi:tetratricopeptide (TPR) repeat protein